MDEQTITADVDVDEALLQEAITITVTEGDSGSEDGDKYEGYVKLVDGDGHVGYLEESSLVVEEHEDDILDTDYVGYADEAVPNEDGVMAIEDAEWPKQYRWHFSSEETDIDVDEYLKESDDENNHNELLEQLREHAAMRDDVDVAPDVLAGDYILYINDDVGCGMLTSRRLKSFNRIDGVEIAYFGWGDDHGKHILFKRTDD